MAGVSQVDLIDIEARVILECGIEKRLWECDAQRRRGDVAIRSRDVHGRARRVLFWRATDKDLACPLQLLSLILKYAPRIHFPHDRPTAKDIEDWATRVRHLLDALATAKNLLREAERAKAAKAAAQANAVEQRNRLSAIGRKGGSRGRLDDASKRHAADQVDAIRAANSKVSLTDACRQTAGKYGVSHKTILRAYRKVRVSEPTHPRHPK